MIYAFFRKSYLIELYVYYFIVILLSLSRMKKILIFTPGENDQRPRQFGLNYTLSNNFSDFKNF